MEGNNLEKSLTVCDLNLITNVAQGFKLIVNLGLHLHWIYGVNGKAFVDFGFFLLKSCAYAVVIIELNDCCRMSFNGLSFGFITTAFINLA